MKGKVEDAMNGEVLEVLKEAVQGKMEEALDGKVVELLKVEVQGKMEMLGE